MPYRHGVYNAERETSLTAPIRGSAGLQVIFGTAPIHLSKDHATAANVPKLCYSFEECVEALGYSEDFERFTLCQSMDACFHVFNVAPVILVNVLDPGKAAHVTQNASADYDVSDGTVLYDKQYVLLNTLKVMNDDAELIYGSDYTAEHAEDGSVVITLLSQAAIEAESVAVSSTSLNPEAVTETDIVGGTNPTTGAETGLDLIRQIYPTLGMVPGLLLAPGWSHKAAVAAAMQGKTEGINGVFDCNCLLDIDSGSSGAKVYTAVKAAKEALGASSRHAVAFWPMGKVGEKVYYLSAVAGALMAYQDASNGDVPYDSPSNKDIRLTGTVLKDGTAVVLDQVQANDGLNANGIVTAINANGFKCWGNNTAAYPATTDPKDRWIAVRRFFDWDGNNFIRTYFEKVDRPANTRLIQSIVDSQNIVGNGYVARGYCAGYRVAFQSDENPVTELLNGHLTLHTYLAPYIPAEQIENIREYDTAALGAALGGE